MWGRWYRGEYGFDVYIRILGLEIYVDKLFYDKKYYFDNILILLDFYFKR